MNFWFRARLAAVAVFVCLLALFVGMPMAALAAPQRVAENRNLSQAGQLRDGVLSLDLEIRDGSWYPEADTGPAVVVEAFAEIGRAPQIPGPLIRVPAGTEVHATLRNRLDQPARVYGLHRRPSDTTEPIEIAPGETRELRFTLAAPGTYDYWATTTGTPMDRRAGVDSQLSGALIVDPPGEAVTDRVFVVGLWLKRSPQDIKQFAVINGKSWPFTERLDYAVGQQVRWRLINTTVFPHPMHLHGSYFRVIGEGNGEADTTLPPDQQRQAVTELMPIGATRTIQPLFEREGRWVFHCHLLVHMSSEYKSMEPLPTGSFMPNLAMQHAMSDATGMGGMVLGITVQPGSNPTPTASTNKQARKITLLVRDRAGNERFPAAKVFQLQEGSTPPPIEDAVVPAAPIVLTQGDPVEITVINQMGEPTAVHWHGIELDSYYDGVPGWGGVGDRVSPSIAAGQSFVASFTPPRAGTFIYHTHWHDFRQLIGGLYGPLIVLPPGQKFDPETDKTITIGLGGGDDLKSPLLLNGSAQPAPLQLKAGVAYRLRLINMTPNGAALAVSLLAKGQPVHWRAIAKDGADLPPLQATAKEARQVVSVGETYDFEFQPTEKGDLRLEVLRPFNRSWAIEEVQVR